MSFTGEWEGGEEEESPSTTPAGGTVVSVSLERSKYINVYLAAGSAVSAYTAGCHMYMF